MEQQIFSTSIRASGNDTYRKLLATLNLETTTRRHHPCNVDHPCNGSGLGQACFFPAPLTSEHIHVEASLKRLTASPAGHQEILASFQAVKRPNNGWQQVFTEFFLLINVFN